MTSLTVGLAGQSAATRKRTVVLYLPLEFGSRWKIAQGQNQGPSHLDAFNRYAVDFDMPIGSPVHAAASGVVTETKEDTAGPTGFYPDNNRIVIRHEDGTHGLYLHFRKDGVDVEVGDVVFAGDRIGWSGNTGQSSGPHLHFSLLSSYPGGVGIPTRFAEVGGTGVPKTGETVLSLNFPIRQLVADVDWLEVAWELARRVDRRAAMKKWMLSHVQSRKLPSAVAESIREAGKRGRKELDKVFRARQAKWQKRCMQDMAECLAAAEAAVKAGKLDVALRLSFAGTLDFDWHPDVKNFRRIYSELASDARKQPALLPVLKELPVMRNQRREFARAMDAAWRAHQSSGKRGAKAIKTARKRFETLISKWPAGPTREALDTWLEVHLPAEKKGD